MDPIAYFEGLASHQLAWIAFLLLAEGAIFTIFPEEVIFLTMGYLVSRGRVSFPEALIACQSGVLFANWAMMFAGRTVGRKLAGLPPLRWFISSEALDRALARISKNGFKILFITRFTPIIRGPIYLATGLSPLPLRKCYAVDFAASCIQVPLLLLAGYYAFDQASVILREARVPVVVAGTIALVVLALRARRRREYVPR